MTKTTIMIFGQLEDITNSSSITIDNVTDTDLLLSKLYEKFPSLKEKKFIIAVNNKIIHEKTEIGVQTKVALLPPFSGG